MSLVHRMVINKSGQFKSSPASSRRELINQLI